MDKTVIVIIAIVILGGFLFWGFASGFFAGIFPGLSINLGKTVVPDGTVLFYGDGCPHCKNVDDFISENNIKDKVKFSSLEVWNNKDNQAILAQDIKKCEMNADEVGIPFLFDGVDKCYMGDEDVINYFKTKAGIQ